MTSSKSKPGRPSGAKNVTAIVDVEPSRCPKCGSSARSKYSNSQQLNFANAGRPFVAINFRRCKCMSCGQWRVDRQPVYKPIAPVEDPAAAAAPVEQPPHSGPPADPGPMQTVPLDEI